MFTHNPYRPLSLLDEQGNLRSEPKKEQVKNPQTHSPYQPMRQDYPQNRYSPPQTSNRPQSRDNNMRESRPLERRSYETPRPVTGNNNDLPAQNDYRRNSYNDYPNRKRERAPDYNQADRKRSKSYRSYRPEENANQRQPTYGQPRGFFQAQKQLQQTVVNQRMEIEKLENKVQQHQQIVKQKEEEVTELKQQLQQLKEKRINETVTEKLKKYMAGKAANATQVVASSPHTGVQVVQNDYSQLVLLKRINLYLESVHKQKISEKGYCHGIVLLWLTMMSWGVESLFYEMIKLIGDCPVDQLSKIQNTITLFLDWIEVGQFPGKYSNQACTQQNVDEIIGEVQKLFSETRKFTKEEMGVEIQKLTKENNMTSVTGWWKNKVTQLEEGHTVGVFVRDKHYHFFDPNYKSGKATEFYSKSNVVDEAWQRVFQNLGVTAGESEKFSINSVFRAEAPKSTGSYTPALFGSVKMRTSTPVPVHEPVHNAPMILART